MLKHLTTLCLLIALANFSRAQQVFYHTSFEIDSSRFCDYVSGNSPDSTDSSFEDFFPDMFTAGYSCDIFSPCNITSFLNFNVPVNSFGQQYPHSGNNYTGLYVASFGSPNNTEGREYFAIKLTSKLKSYKYYKIEYYVSVGDFMRYTTLPPQIYYSADSFMMPTQPEPAWLYYSNINYSKVLCFDSTAHLNTDDWIKIEGIFHPEGNEQYLYVGNFFKDADSPIDYINYPNAFSEMPYYYVDDLTLYELDSTYVGIEENSNINISINPNPASENVTITLPPNTNKAELFVYTVQGQLLSQTQLNCTQTINTSNLTNGLYLFVIQSNENIIGREKVIVTH